MKPSFGYKLLTAVFRATRYRDQMIKDAASGNQRNALPKGKMAKRWERSEFDGRAVWTCHPEAGPSDRVYIHEHGGGYVYGILPGHYMSLSELADHSGQTVILPDYPLPPQIHAPGIIDWADRHLTAVVENYGVGNVSIGGCSAGGNLALAVLQRRAERGDPHPAKTILWSPWVDLTEAETPPTKADDYEAVITPFGLEPAVENYLGDSGMDRASPIVSPMLADMTALPVMDIVTGAKDILNPSIVKFAEKAKAAGKLGHYITEPDYGHYWMFYPLKDRHHTLKQIAGWLS
jgi:acetyl esterase/lipase